MSRYEFAFVCMLPGRKEIMHDWRCTNGRRKVFRGGFFSHTPRFVIVQPSRPTVFASDVRHWRRTHPAQSGALIKRFAADDTHREPDKTVNFDENPRFRQRYGRTNTDSIHKHTHNDVDTHVVHDDESGRCSNITNRSVVVMSCCYFFQL